MHPLIENALTFGVFAGLWLNSREPGPRKRPTAIEKKRSKRLAKIARSSRQRNRR